MIENISGVILAGGANSRFNGIVKANLVIGGRTIISRQSALLSEIFREVIIVTNTPEEFKEYTHFRIVADVIQNKGPLGGIHAALKASSGEAVFVFAGDMPLINKEIISRQMIDYTDNHCEILIPEICDNIEPLHAVYNSCVLPTLEKYLSDNSNFAIREFVRIMDVRYLKLECCEEYTKAFSNINTTEDLKHFEEIMKFA